MLHKVYSWTFWQVQAYSDIGGNDAHYVECFDCATNFHWQHEYNVVYSTMPKGKVGVPQLTAKYVVDGSNSGDGAISVVKAISNSGCFLGVHVMQRYIDEWTYSDYGNAWHQQVGSQHTVVVWQYEGSTRCTSSIKLDSE